MTAPTIRVELENGIWCAAHFDEQGNPQSEVVDLFGTHILPTPWFLPTPEERVVEALREMSFSRGYVVE